MQAPYDTQTLTNDLRGLMDALKISEAHLAGWSMGGNEITAMAADYPARVGKLVYLDGGYDYADPDFERAFRAIPASLLHPPSSAMESPAAYWAYQMGAEYGSLEKIDRVKNYLQESVNVQPSGQVQLRMSQDLMHSLCTALWSNAPREYSRVRAKALAIYAESVFGIGVRTPVEREKCTVWERTYMIPFRAKSIHRIQRELADVETHRVAGTHGSFFVTERENVVDLMRNFLNAGQLGPATG